MLGPDPEAQIATFTTKIPTLFLELLTIQRSVLISRGEKIKNYEKRSFWGCFHMFFRN
jgi:hypothetical protein